MVWALRAEDPALASFYGTIGCAAAAPASYYLKSASTYSVGRKDCYITIQIDKTISRLHANFITEEAKQPQADINDAAQIPRMPLRVHDLSKFGTFVNKKPGAKPVNTLPGSEAPLNDGDVVTFGTNKTSFRLEYIPFFFCVSTSKAITTSGHGAYAAESWKEGCTHVLVDEGSAVKDMVIAAAACRKPVVQIDWWQKFSMETQVVTEMPPHTSYLPTLVYQGVASSTPIKIALPDSRRNILQNYSFFLVPLDVYEHGNYLVRLLEAAGATVKLLSRTSSSSIISSGAGGRQQMVVKPRDGTVKQGWADPAILNIIRHVPRTSEDKLVPAVLAGSVDVTSLPLPPSPVASADSDETTEELDANEEVEDTADTLSFKAFATTPPASPVEAGATATIPIDVDEDSLKRTSKRSRQHESSSNAEAYGGTEPVDDNDAKRQKLSFTEAPGSMSSSQGYKLPNTEVVLEPATRGHKRTSSMTIDKFFSQNAGSTRAKKLQPTSDDALLDPLHVGSSKTELPGVAADSGAADVVYGQLVVRKDAEIVPSPATPTQGSAPNFKRFRKKGLGIGVSGNTFTSLVPFAKEPYRGSDMGREKNEFMQEERRRKEAERIAEDLFHNEKLKNATGKPRSRSKK